MSCIYRIAAVAVGLVALNVGEAMATICDPRFTVKDKSYVQLGSVSPQWPVQLANVFLWVDDINSSFWTGAYDPFQVYVLIGNVYAPFSAKTGKLNRADFLRLSDPKNVNNDRRGPFQVPRSFKEELRLPAFAVGKLEFWLAVKSIKSSRGGDDRVELQVCRF